MYPLLDLATIQTFLPKIKDLGVSIVARSTTGFLPAFKRYGKNLPKEWVIKRENFIKRHLVQYKKNPTIRRRLSLITWAFDPDK
jgi:hypothetical protein